jgi:septum formation protein
VSADGSIVTETAFAEKTKVTFDTLNESEINQYIATGSPMDKAGAYGIQDDYGSLFIKKIEGDYYNVVGFPVNRFYQTLKSDYPDMFKKVFNL